MSAVAARVFELDLSHGQVDFIVDDQRLFRADFVKAGKRGGGLTTTIHKCGRLEQPEFMSFEHDAGS